jgi:hypothetical protein
MDFCAPQTAECVQGVDSPTLFYLDNLLDVDDWGHPCIKYEDAPAYTYNHLPTYNADARADSKPLRTEDAEIEALRAENAELKAATQELEILVQNLHGEVMMLTAMKEAAARTSRRDPVVNFAVGGHAFTGKLYPEIHFARAGSQFAVYPPGSHPPAVGKLDLAKSRFETLSADNAAGHGGVGGAGAGAGGATSELVPFIGSIHSIVQVGKA